MDRNIRDLEEKIRKLEREISDAKTKEEKGEGKEKKFVPLEVLYQWKSPARVYVQRDRAWFLKVAVGALIVILLFAFLQDFLVILVICIIVLVAFLLASIPPHEVDHKITNKGIESIDKMYKWEDLEEFWVAEKFGQKIVYIRTSIRFPARLMMLIDEKDEEAVVKLLGQKLGYKEYQEKQGWIAKVSDGEMIDPKDYEKLFKALPVKEEKSPKK